MNKQRFNFLLEKYKQNSLSPEEYQELLDILREPGSEDNLDQLLTRYWQDMPLKSSASQLPGKDVQPNVSPSQRFDTAQRDTFQPQPQPQPYFYWGIAATLLLLVGLFFYLWEGTELLGQKEIVYTTGFGERLEIDLDDGSHITLNANSELRWLGEWEEAQDRQVILEGEAFFEVKKQHGIPFTVRTDDVAVEVLGTSFNVDSREENTEVYLDEGKVNLKLLSDLDGEDEKPEKEIIMKPGDQVRYSAREKKVEKSEGQTLITAAAWKNNVLNFKNMLFSEVLDLLRDIYGQSFECTDGELLSKPMYLGVPYSDWEAVRQALELSLNVEFEKTAARRYEVKSLKK